MMMFIRTEQTPNPETLKFIPGQDILGTGTAEFRNEEEAAPSPLAQRLFRINGVRSVFFGGDFVSVTKDQDEDWDILNSHIINAMMEHFTSGLPVMEDLAEQNAAVDEDDDEITFQIKQILEERVRPAVAMDGGDIAFERFEDGVVYLRMHGACSGCPSSTMTLKSGVENLLKHFVPEVESVEAIEG